MAEKVHTRRMSVLAHVGLKRMNESARYALFDRRRMAAAAVQGVLDTAFLNLPHKLTHFTPALLGTEGRRYLLVTHDDRAISIYGGRLSLKIVTIRQGRAVVDATGEDRGEIAPLSFGRYQAVPADLHYYKPALKASGLARYWRDIPFAENRFGSTLLPLDKDIVQGHPALARLVDLANAILDGRCAEIATLEAIDATYARLEAESDVIAHLARELAIAGIDVDALTAEHADLVAMLKVHDWSHHEADRSISRAMEMERRIKSGIDALDEDDAVALFMAHVPVYWTMIGGFVPDARKTVRKAA